MSSSLNQTPALNLAVPCYNRPQLVKGLLQNIIDIDLHKKVRLGVLIVDNSEDSRVLNEVQDFQEIINITYIKNPVNIGAGKNVIECFKLSSGDFLHIISDKVRFKREYIDVILEVMDRDCKLSFLEYDIYDQEPSSPTEENCVDEIEGIELDFSNILAKKSYKLTHLSSLIFNLNFLDFERLDLDLDLSFIPHTHVFFNQASISNNVLVFNNASLAVGGNNSVIYSILDVFYVDFLGIYKKYRRQVRVIDRLRFSMNHFLWLQRVLWGVRDKKRMQFLIKNSTNAKRKFEFKFFVSSITNSISLIRNRFKDWN